MSQTLMKISDIIIKERIRKSIGDTVPLEKSIHKLGLLHPVVVSKKNELIAGKRRILAYENLGLSEIPVSIIDLDKLIDGEIDENQIREDFTSDEVLAIEDYVLPAIKEENPVGRPKKGAEPAQLKDDEEKTSKKTRVAVAEKVGLSHDSLKKLREIKDESITNPKFIKLYENIDNHNSRDTINSVYQKLKKLKKSRERKVALEKTQVNLPESVQLHNKEFQKVIIEGNSVSLIMTDPPYHEKYLHLFEDLAVHASRVLRPGGSLLTYVGHGNIIKVGNMMEKHGLSFHWPIAVIHSGPSASVFGKKILVGYKPMLWFTKGKYEGEFVKDTIKSEFQGKDLHEWAQSTVESDYYIKYLTTENEIVYDPFLGQGTFGVSAVKLKRQFIGCEVDPEHFANAEKMISNVN